MSDGIFTGQNGQDAGGFRFVGFYSGGSLRLEHIELENCCNKGMENDPCFWLRGWSMQFDLIG